MRRLALLTCAFGVIRARGGNDLVCGLGGNDMILGGAGRPDLCNGGPDRDQRQSPGCERRRLIP